ncbi:amidohydrolase family protein [Actinoplanes sp. NPDC023936]|uniref:amidohydrolase family protein n=1 Tax=Actinoplanes sp. NPDC023936 TaxID=3154910 RepID=UPI0033CE8178
MQLIDVHHHADLDVVKAKRAELGMVMPPFVPEWNPAIGIERMDMIGTTLSVLSMPAGTTFAPPSAAPQLARAINEEYAELIRKYPTRYGAFATLPMPCVSSSTDEAIHALDVLNLDGVCMQSSYDGVYLADRRYDGLLAALNSRDAVVFIHPILIRERIADLPPALLEGTFDTTRAATRLAAADVFARYPRIRFILPHTGGMVPYIKWRIAMYALQGDDWRVEAGPDAFAAEIAKLDGIYYDTTLNLGPVEKLVDPARILFGTDIPWANDAVLRMQREAVRDPAIAAGNALRLFPRIADVLR